jgi:hypothetical protein
VYDRAEPVPAIEIKADENGFQEKGIAFEAEQISHHGAEQLDVFRPQQTQLQRQGCARHGAHRKQQSGGLRPLFGQSLVVRLPRP